jgi:alpha-L-fucosidase
MLTRRRLLDLVGKGIVMAGPAGAVITGAGAMGASAFAQDVAEPAMPKPSTSPAVPGENESRLPPRFHDGRDWFMEKRFGLFVTWGIYAVAGYHEQHMYRKEMTREEYLPFMHQFNPTKFDPDAWLDLAQEAGMEYVVFVTKHIDGFCMWNTHETTYNIMNTPYGKDTLKMLADACHRRKVPLCLYYSIVDEHQPNYPTAGRPYELPAPPPGDEPDMEKYLAFVKRQVRELCTNYGEIHGFWWDAFELGIKDPSFNELIRSLQPNAVINNRGFDEGDYSTPERDWDNSVNTELSFRKRVEACQSVGFQSWSYRIDEDYYSTAHLIRSIQKILAKSGNYVLSVGPKGDGTIPEEAASILRQIGKWYKPVKESLVGVEPAGMMTKNRDVLLTQRGDTLYVHVFKEQEIPAIYLPPIATLPRRATLLNTGEKVECEILATPRLAQQKPNHCLRLKNLPVTGAASVGLVVKLEFDHLAA